MLLDLLIKYRTLYFRTLQCLLPCRLGRHVSRYVDFIWKFRNVDFKARLDLFKDFLVLLGADKGNSNPLRSEATSASDAVKELIAIIGYDESPM